MPEPEQPSFAARGGAWVAAQSILMLLVIVLGVVFQGHWRNHLAIVSGTVLFMIAAWFGIAGVRRLGRNRTPFPRPHDDSELVDFGIYARVRHPLYTSVMLACIGWALIWQSIPALTVSLLLVPFFRAKAVVEEQWLRKKFPKYAIYETRVPRFFPRFSRRR